MTILSTETPDTPTTFGSGWISGVLSVACAAIGLGAVLCLLYPSWLTVADARSLYPLPYIRALIHLFLVAAFVLGAISLCLRRRKTLGAVGVTLTLVAALLGGSRVPIDGELRTGPYLGLDWFLLNLVFFSLVFVPLERLFAHRPDQPVFRKGWRTDLVYFFVSSLLVQVTTLLTLKPAMVLFDWAAWPPLQARVSGLPFVVQLPAVLFVSDFVQYWVHRAFHAVPWLWRFHAIHHSAEAMDWLAGSRLHLVDAVVTRALAFVPLYVLGFGDAAIFTYVALVSLHATFIHANLRFEFGALAWVLATPRFHHWHHGAEREAIDRNFAVHLPVIDLLFGTAHLPPGRWPASYGLSTEKVPDGYLQQLVRPFRSSPGMLGASGLPAEERGRACDDSPSRS
jgi:sterol desaturase/sphingolipid hydroxylase (fatty acid hydroxylase superfamily)